MRKVTMTEVKYEALGKSYTSYTEIKEIQIILAIIKLISISAHLHSVKRISANPSLLKHQNLKDIITWNDEITEKFNHIDKEAIQ